MRIRTAITHLVTRQRYCWGARALAALLLTLALLPQGFAATIRANFDHLTTGFELIGQHRDLPCESCHANAVFKGTPTDCAACHGIGTTVRATAKPANHILSTDRCASCHTPIAWNPAVNFDHTQVRGNCSTCHNGVMAQGKGPTHIVTDLECDACHTTLTWAGAFFTHKNVTSNCASCHNGVSATGMPVTHIPVGTPPTPCEGCHSTTNFTTWAGTLINHLAVTALTCASCHETGNYLGMHPSTNTAAGDSRPPTALDPIHPAKSAGDCGVCHDTVTFAGSAVRPANHIPTSAPCSQCHTTAGNYKAYSVTGTHQGVTGCLTCHGPTVATTFDIAVVTTPGNHIPIGSLDCNGSGCHSTSNVNPGGFRLGAANLSSPTLSVAGHSTVAGMTCMSCHESAPYMGMLASTTTASDSRPTFDALHPTTGDCSGCHTTAPTFTTNQSSTALPPKHIPTTAPCAQCHTTAGNYAMYSSPGTHQGVSGCLSCHGSTVNTTFLNVTMVTTPGNHIPIGGLDCNGSGCHTTSNVTPQGNGFKIGTASISSPTLNAAGHVTAAGAGACASCHETASYLGMTPSTAMPGGDSRPGAYDSLHPTTGDCGNCHVTTPTFGTNLLPTTAKPSNHIPTTAVCAQCHTTPGNFALYSVTGTHQGVTACLSCHGTGVGPFVNVTMVTAPGNHIPFGAADCNGSGCHSTSNVNPGGFRLGAANLSSPTLNVAGHATVAGVGGCMTCHESSPYLGMMASTAGAWGDSRPQAFDKVHPAAGECSTCHTTTPTFATNQSGSSAKPANHIPTSAPCAQCHTTAGNFAAYSSPGTHQGVTGCLTCHGPTVNTTFYNVTMVTTTTNGNHIPIGALDCNASGCHSTSNVTPGGGGFRLGAASLTAPTLTVAGHATVASPVPGCMTCHETSPFVGMMASTATAAGDSRPQAFDKLHPASGDCNGCHSTSPTFTTNQMGSSAKPATHIPTSLGCAVCHTTPGNYGLYVMGVAGHAGITNNCKQCHAYGLSFYNMAPPTLVEPAAGATGHIPAVPPNGTGTLDCVLCHTVAAASFATFSGTVMKHAYVTSMTCMACHETNAQWKTNGGGIWRRPNGHKVGQDCGGSGCHSARDKRAVRPAATVSTATTKPGTGVTTARAGVGPRAGAGPRGGTAAPALGQPAPATAGAAPAVPFNHATIGATACVTCHTAASGSGKPATHIATSNNCQSCHTTLAWLPVRAVDHTQVTGTCVSCHNGVVATGKRSSHVPTSAGCESCHTTNAWMPARFDHLGVAAHTCTTCHNSVRAVGMARMHIPTTQQCDVCHGTLAWKPARVDHSTFTSGCASCHNNGGATGLSPGHMSTRLDCATCHSYPDWSINHFRHTSVAYPGTHRTALSCTSCHTSNTDQVPYSAPANAGTCGGCHAKDFKPAAHPKTVKGLNYTASELANCSGACHVYSDTTQSTITRSLPGPHHRVSDATFKH
jgi:hypothetical protein